jgi:hypothetical protein
VRLVLHDWQPITYSGYAAQVLFNQKSWYDSCLIYIGGARIYTLMCPQQVY